MTFARERFFLDLSVTSYRLLRFLKCTRSDLPAFRNTSGRFGYNVRIMNIAVKMLRSKRFDVEKTISELHPLIFGIDLHWMPHVQGSLALAEIVKKYHPNTPVIFGGLSSTYYHEELLRCYPYIDFVMRGDSTEEPLRQLRECDQDSRIFREYSQSDLEGRSRKSPGQPPDECACKSRWHQDRLFPYHEKSHEVSGPLRLYAIPELVELSGHCGL